MNDITEQYLNKLYEDLSKEQMRLLTDMKSSSETEKERDLTKQIGQIQSLMLGSLKLRNMRKKLAEKF